MKKQLRKTDREGEKETTERDKFRWLLLEACNALYSLNTTMMGTQNKAIPRLGRSF